MYYLYYVIKKCPSGHCHNSFMATGHLGTPMYGYMFLTFRIQTKLKLTLQQQG